MILFDWIGKKVGLSGDQAKRFWASFAGGNWSGETVTFEKAMMVMAFWRGVRLTAETVATLPPNIYEYLNGSSEGTLARGNQYDTLLRVSPSLNVTSVEFWEAMVGAMIVVGNGYALKQRIGGRIVSMDLMVPDPAYSYPYRDANKNLRYRLRDWQGRDYLNVDPADVFHLKGFSFGSDSGLSALYYGSQALGMTIAANKVAGRTFASGLSSSGFLETNQVLNEPDRDRLNEIMGQYQSNSSPGKMMILEGGMKYNKLSMTAVDAQLLETMGFNIDELGRLLGMPPILLGHSSNGQTMWGTGVESIIQAWYTLGLRAILTRIEKCVQARVIEVKDQARYYFRFNVKGLLRGDSQTQALIAASMVQNGIRNRDEVRADDDDTPIPGGGGKIFTAQTNLATLDRIANPPDQAPSPFGGGPADQAAVENFVLRLIEREMQRNATLDALREDRLRHLPAA
jgi:HK97 family phage portal protein